MNVKFVEDLGFAVERAVKKDLWARDRRGVEVVRFDRNADGNRAAPRAVEIVVRNIVGEGSKIDTGGRTYVILLCIYSRVL